MSLISELQRRHAEACNYPGVVDPVVVTRHLERYTEALGVSRHVMQLQRGWDLQAQPALARTIDGILQAAQAAQAARDARDARAARAAQAARDARDARAARAALDALDAQAALDARAARDARAALAALDALDALGAQAALDARDARAALDALDARAAQAARAARAALDALDAQAALDARAARDALQRFACWCIARGSWWSWDISWLTTTHIGAVALDKTEPQAWSEPLFEAFCAGCWLLYWTDDTLYWVAKPTVHVENRTAAWTGRLHNDISPAVDSDLEPWYFVHGVMVPEYVVMRPNEITVEQVDSERNAEVRRVMIERYGQSRYLLDSGAIEVHSDEWGTLYRKDLDGDEPLMMVHVVNATPEGHYVDTDEWETYEITDQDVRAEIAELVEDEAPLDQFRLVSKPGSYMRRKQVFVPDLDENGREIINDYYLRVHPELRLLLADKTLGDPQPLTALNAVASTFGVTGREYATQMVAQT